MAFNQRYFQQAQRSLPTDLTSKQGKSQVSLKLDSTLGGCGSGGGAVAHRLEG